MSVRAWRPKATAGGAAAAARPGGGAGGSARPRRAILSGRLVGGMWGREWLVTLAHPRALVVRVAVPLGLALPLVAGGAPSFWAAMLLTVLVAMVGAVGCGMTVARARASGLLTRLAAVPQRPERTVGGWILASAAIDACQLGPALVVVLAAGGGDLRWWPVLGIAAVAILLLANVLGCALALAAGGPGEVLLDVGVSLAPLLYLAGVFTGVPRTGLRGVVARLDPFSSLDASFIGALGGAPAYSAAAAAAAALAWLGLGLVAIIPLSRTLLARP